MSDAIRKLREAERDALALKWVSTEQCLVVMGKHRNAAEARADRLSAMLKEAEGERDAAVAEAARQAYAIGVYDQQNSAEKLDPAKTFPISGAAAFARLEAREVSND